jgi:predicted transcriptional regulator
MSSLKRKLKTLTLEEKVHLIRTVEEGQLKKNDIAENFGIPPSTLSTIIRSKDKVLSAHEKRLFTASCKKMKTAKHEDVEAALLRWFREVRDSTTPVSGTLMREKADQLGKEFGVDFSASVGWLERFKHRHGIVF